MTDLPGTLPVVFVHGIRLSGTMWDTVLAEMPPDRRTSAPDMPGHGTRRGDDFTLDAAVATVMEAVDALGGRAMLVGHSMGGFISTAVAGRHPESVAGLVTLGSAVRPTGFGLRTFRTMAALAARNPDRANRLTAWTLRRSLPADLAEAMLRGGSHCEVLPDVVTAIAGLDVVQSLADYGGPVWFVNGTLDLLGSEARALAAPLARAHVITIARGGHFTPMVRRSELVSWIVEALAVCERSMPAT